MNPVDLILQWLQHTNILEPVAAMLGSGVTFWTIARALLIFGRAYNERLNTRASIEQTKAQNNLLKTEIEAKDTEAENAYQMKILNLFERQTSMLELLSRTDAARTVKLAQIDVDIVSAKEQLGILNTNVVELPKAVETTLTEVGKKIDDMLSKQGDFSGIQATIQKDLTEIKELIRKCTEPDPPPSVPTALPSRRQPPTVEDDEELIA